MGGSNWAPSIGPSENDQTVYLVANDFGKPGRVWTEAEYERTDLEAVVQTAEKLNAASLLMQSTQFCFYLGDAQLIRRYQPKRGHAQSGLSACQALLITSSRNAPHGSNCACSRKSLASSARRSSRDLVCLKRRPFIALSFPCVLVSRRERDNAFSSP
jgi:hypothetical protein